MRSFGIWGVLLALLVTVAGCGGSGGGKGNLAAVWPEPGLYRVQRAKLSDGTSMTLQVGISPTVGRGGIRFSERKGSEFAEMGNMLIDSATPVLGGIQVSGAPDEHTFGDDAPEYTYTIQEDGTGLKVTLGRNGFKHVLRLARVEATAPSRKVSAWSSPRNAVISSSAYGSVVGRVIYCDQVYNTDYGDYYAKMMVYLDPNAPTGATDWQGVMQNNELASIAGFVVPTYYIGDDLNTLDSSDSNVGGYLVGYYDDAGTVGSGTTIREYLQLNDDGSVTTMTSFHFEGVAGTNNSWENSRPKFYIAGDNDAARAYSSTVDAYTIDAGTGAAVTYSGGSEPSLVGFTLDDPNDLSILVDAYTGSTLAYTWLSSSEVLQTYPGANVWVSVLNSPAVRGNVIGLNLGWSGVGFVQNPRVFGR